MLKREITYTDFDGNEVTETYYFNISMPEFVDLEVEIDGGLTNMLQRISETQDYKGAVNSFKKIITLAYGVKSADGKRFEKNEGLLKEFMDSAAYIALYMELVTDPAVGVKFIEAVLPKELQNTDQDKPNVQTTNPV